MDGNGRWAGERHLPRVEGHRAGVDSVRDVVETSARLGLEVLTLYAFSVENWKRPAAEVSTLMMLLKRYLGLELETLLRNNIRFNVIGRAEALAPDVRTELLDAERKTAKNTGMLFNIALNYGGRTEIVDAARRAIESGITPEDLDEDRFASLLYTGGQPDPDLLIRTSGEMRVSNFLLWQIAYAEIWVTDTLWPDFRCRHLLEGVLAYQKRDRRFGGITPPVPRASGELKSRVPSPSMTRVISGVVLGAVALALIWFLSSIALLGVALVVAAMAFHEYDRIVDEIGAKVPYWTTLLATLLVCSMVPFQWVDIESVLAGGAAADRAQRAGVGSRRRAAARGHRGGGAGAGLHRPAARLPGRRARDRRQGSGAAVDRDGRGQRHRAVLHRPHARPHAAGAAAQPEENARGRDRRIRDRAGCFSRSPARTGCLRFPGTGTPASASASSSPASSATCSSRC